MAAVVISSGQQRSDAMVVDHCSGGRVFDESRLSGVCNVRLFCFVFFSLSSGFLLKVSRWRS